MYLVKIVLNVFMYRLHFSKAEFNACTRLFVSINLSLFRFHHFYEIKKTKAKREKVRKKCEPKKCVISHMKIDSINLHYQQTVSIYYELIERENIHLNTFIMMRPDEKR